MNKCLYCYKELRPDEVDFHPECARKMFGTSLAPDLPYSRDNLSGLAEKIIKTSTSVTGVQAKLSLEIDRGKKNEPSRFTIVGLWGNYILKPQSTQYRSLPELEDATMKMAETANIKTARHSLIRFSDGELGYITLRMDRGKKGQKYSMLDMCQLSNRLTEHKYLGSYEQLAQTIVRYSIAPYLDVQKFWEIVLFSWVTGNSDMHCKNFSLLDEGKGYLLSPAYDLLAVLLADPNDVDELAMPLFTGGSKTGFTRESFVQAFVASGVQEVTAEKLITKMVGHKDKWLDIIDHSFLPDDLKIRYKELISIRLETLVEKRVNGEMEDKISAAERAQYAIDEFYTANDIAVANLESMLEENN